jgi:transposase-like protein
MDVKHAKPSAQAVVKDIRRAMRKQYGAEEKIRIVLEGLRGEHSIAELCRREGPMSPCAQGVYYKLWSACQFQSMSSSQRDAGQLSAILAMTSAIYACGSMPLGWQISITE